MRVTGTVVCKVAASLATALVIGCATHPPLTEMTQDEAFSYLSQRFTTEHYLDAAEGLDYFTLNYSGSAVIDSAQLLLGWSHYHLKEFLVAASSFEELPRRFPNSPLAPEALHSVGLCYWKLSPRYSLDQEYTNKCIDAFQNFIDNYPKLTARVGEAQEYIGKCRDKLARKEYESGVIYLKMKDYQAAALYFRKITELYYDTQWAAWAAFQLGRAFEAQEAPGEAADAYRYFIEKYPDHPMHSRAEAALTDLSNRLGG